MEKIIIELVKEFGSLGVVLWLVLWTQCRVIPGMHRDCRDERKEQRDAQVITVGQLSEKLGLLSREIAEIKRRNNGE